MYIYIFFVNLIMSLSIRFSNVYLMNLMGLLMEKGVKRRLEGDEKSTKRGKKWKSRKEKLNIKMQKNSNYW